jgi:LysM repeat protein
MCQASPATKHIVNALEREYKSAVFSGIVPDKRHLRQGGYHCCLVHLFANGNADDYSNRRKLDQSTVVSSKGRSFSAAFDVSMAKADMMKLHARVRKVFLDRTDPRRKYVNAINCWDGSGSAVRYDFQANTASWATPDHTWHAHGDQPRMYVDTYGDEKRAMKAARAYASILVGEAKATWISREEPKPAPKPAPPAVKPKPITHRVVKGDTLWAIGRRYGVSVAQLKVWNGLKNDNINPGQILRLTLPPKPSRHTVVKGDTLWAIAKKYKTSVAQIKAWNGLKNDNIFPGRVLRVA